ncbi:MAG: GNAT family N-acetyltransferase [Candidatus Gracilibacteria bacterium]|nr:GNAT family N-acetyltransferase [Candidatus Gracilibacteria bacterium]MDQ7023733.1 GNAT family N-acetyltransferase [Candidatus Gracilibacteria bacterium]
MKKIVKIRLQEVNDAERFYKILNNDNFKYFNVRPSSVEKEIEYLKLNEKFRKENTQWNYTVLFGDEIVGGIGIKINSHTNFMGEMGYFLDESFWGKGIITEATKLLEKICFEELNLTRIEILMKLENIGSEKVAIKCGYKKEGICKNRLKDLEGNLKDCYIYAKVL